MPKEHELKDFRILHLPLPWRGLIASLIFFSFSLVLNCISQSPDNYFDRIAMVSDGRLTRFTELPVTVYVEGLAMQGRRYADDVRYAMKEWEDCSDGMLKFELVDLPDGANILVSWVRRLEAGEREHPMGIAELQRTDRDEFHVEMRICSRDRKTNKPLTNDQMKTVLLHEFGHAVGLWGHSKDKADVMYYAADALHPTPRDANTLKMVYSHEPNYSLHSESISAIGEELKSKPEDARLHFLLGTTYADQEKYDQAIDSLKRCLSLNPEFHKASAALASAYRASGQGQAALIEYISLAESDPSAMLHNVIGALYFEQKDTARAIQHFKRALELERAYEPAKRNLYTIYLNRGKELINESMYYAAIDLLLDGIGFFPDKPELHETLGTAYNRTGQFQKAIDQYTQALRINPGFMPARSNMAGCYNNQGVKYAESGQWEKAVEAYTEALRFAPGMKEAERNISAAYWNRAVELSKAGRDSEAIEAYKQFLARDPNNKEAYNNLGAVYFRTAQYQKAAAAFKSALDLDPGSKEIRHNLAIAYHKQGVFLLERKAYSQAAREFEKGLEIAPDDINLHLSLAQVYQRLEKWDDATQHINKALELEPGNTTARKIMANLNIQRGAAYLQAKEYQKSLHCYSEVPDDLMPPSTHNTIGYLYIMEKMYLEAVDEFDEVLEADPKDKIAHQNLLSIESRLSQARSQEARSKLARVRLSLAMSHMGRGNRTNAKNVLKSAIDLRPQDKDLRYLLAEGCIKLAEVFKQRNALKEAGELTDWSLQLRSGGS
jgi:tetratricopeptide (TPR) repeat protein